MPTLAFSPDPDPMQDLHYREAAPSQASLRRAGSGRGGGLLLAFRSRLLRGVERRDGGLQDAALASAGEALRGGADEGLLRAWRAEYHANFGSYRHALTDLDLLVADGPRALWALSVRGEVNTELRRFKRVFADYEALVSGTGRAAWAVALLGRAKAKAGLVDEGLRRLDAAVAGSAGEWWLPVVAAWRGEARRKAGDLRGAHRDFDAALEAYPLARAWKGRTLLAQRRFAAARSCLDRALRSLKPVDAELALLWRAEASFGLGDFAAALRDLGRVYPLSAKASWTGGVAGLKSDLARAVKAHPVDAAAWALSGRLLGDLGANEQALWLLERACALAPRRPEAWAWRGELRCRRGDGAGLRDLERACRLGGPRWQGALAQERLRAGDADGALTSAEAALRGSPAEAWLHQVRGRALLALRRPGEARAALRRALALSVRSAETYFWLSEAERRCGRGRESLDHFAEALLLDPQARWCGAAPDMRAVVLERLGR